MTPSSTRVSEDILIHRYRCMVQTLTNVLYVKELTHVTGPVE